MAILALALYGSCARGDADEGSDVDLLVITDVGKVQTVSYNKTTFSYYPKRVLLKLARKGDLFLLHLIREAKSVYGYDKIAEELARSFKFKSKYTEDILKASDVAWFILQNYRKISDVAFLNKRIAWCVRTILIAKSADKRKPVFSANELSRLAKSEEVYRLIKNKTSAKKARWVIEEFEAFLKKFGASKPRSDFADLGEMTKYFQADGNFIGLSLVKKAIKRAKPHNGSGYI